VRLTAAAQQLVEHADAVLARIEEAEADLAAAEQ
jgi:DNA-binding transcriptional LysR family regulator